MSFTTFPFALVLVRHPTTGKFAVVEETGRRGLWISGGRVDPGEKFETAAIREAKEELGIDIKLTGIIRVEHSLMSAKEARMRVIFTGEPVDPDGPLKTIPDKESVAGHWMSLDDILKAQSEHKLRGELTRLRSSVDCAQRVVKVGRRFARLFQSDCHTIPASPVCLTPIIYNAGDDFVGFVKYVAGGGAIAPLSFLADESDELA